MTKRDSRIVYISCGQNGLFGLAKLIEFGFKHIHIFSLRPEVAIAANVSGYADFTTFSRQNQIPLSWVENYAFSDKNMLEIEEFAPDLILVNGWNRLIPPAIFNMARLGGYGVHAGHPPRGRGRAPVAWTLIKGLRDLEVYLFQLDVKADAGPIVGLQKVEVTAFDDASTLYDKVALAVAKLYERCLPTLLTGALAPIAQDASLATELPKRIPEDGRIDWSMSDWELYNFIRGQTLPYPGAFTSYDCRRLYVWTAIPFDRILPFDIRTQPGEILELLPSGIVVKTGTSPLLLRRLQFADSQQILQTPLSTHLDVFQRGKIFG